MGDYCTEVALLVDDLREFARDIQDTTDLDKIRSIAAGQVRHIEFFEKDQQNYTDTVAELNELRDKVRKYKGIIGMYAEILASKSQPSASALPICARPALQVIRGGAA